MDSISDSGDLQIEEADDVGTRRRGRKVKIQLMKPEFSTTLEILIDAGGHNFLSVSEAWVQKLLNNDMEKYCKDLTSSLWH
uniref:Skp1_POZ domain-containing protein n=1 Tax=Strongyloides papillosus TaxID=174720 RepID=A0A0N5B3J9_STREA